MASESISSSSFTDDESSTEADYTNQQPVPEEVIESVAYAKVSSYYLIGKAASIQHLQNEVTRRSIRIYMQNSDASPATASLELAQATQALNDARQELKEEFHHFASDSASWAHYLKSGLQYDEEEGGYRPPYVREAEEIIRAVSTARMAVVRACGEGFWLKVKDEKGRRRVWGLASLRMGGELED